MQVESESFEMPETPLELSQELPVLTQGSLVGSTKIPIKIPHLLSLWMKLYFLQLHSPGKSDVSTEHMDSVQCLWHRQRKSSSSRDQEEQRTRSITSAANRRSTR